MIPKGKLFIIGGHEDKGFTGETPQILEREIHPTHFEILGSLISTVPKAHHRIEVIAAASAVPAEMEEMYVTAYKNVGFEDVSIIRLDTIEDASKEEYIKRIHYAHSVFFTGGDQKRLVSLIGNSPLFEAIKRKYQNDPNFIVAGTSAGAMSIPEIMISRGIIEEAIMKKDMEMHDGLGLIEGVIVDTHFIKRGRLGRLAYAVALNPSSCIGFGIGEDAAIIISNGNEAVCSGTGMIIVIDGSNIGATNIETVDEYTAVAIENLKLHILTNGCKFLIKEKQFIMKE